MVKVVGHDTNMAKGSAEVGGFAVNQLNFFTPEGVGEQIANKKTGKDSTDVYGEGHKRIYSEIVSDQKSLPNEAIMGSEGLASIRLIHAIYKSVEEERTVFLDEKSIASSNLP